MVGGRRHFHVITPGDHFSPRTGSAVPTVVHGLAAAVAEPRSAVVVARGTYADHYDSADVVEYEADPVPFGAPRRADPFVGLLGLARPEIGRTWRATLAGQRDWPEAYVLGHNAPQLMRYVDTQRHVPVLYAHNELLRSYPRWETARTLGGTHRIVCVSAYLADRTAARLPRRIADRIRVVGNGVDTEAFHPAWELRDTERMTVLFVGRTIPDKGVDVLLRAAALLATDAIEILVLGSQNFDPHAPLSPYESSLRELAAASRTPVRFLPTVGRHRIPDVLRTADVLVVPSRWPEPYGLTVTEGMATGIPVVASAVGGIPEALGGSGILVPPDDPDALVDALRGLADDPAERRRLGAAAREHAVTHDWRWARRELDAALSD